jgi:hypothetical protein
MVLFSAIGLYTQLMNSTQLLNLISVLVLQSNMDAVPKKRGDSTISFCIYERTSSPDPAN